MADNIDKKEPVAICDQTKIDVTKCDNHELAGNIEPLIKVIRGQQVMLDKDLATLYGVETRVLNQTVKRNIERFPDDFRFELSREECLRSQIVISNGRGGNRYSTYAFTEQGVAMLSSVLRSQTAIEVNIQIMRAFVSMRHFTGKKDRITIPAISSVDKLRGCINIYPEYYDCFGKFTGSPLDRHEEQGLELQLISR